MKSNDGDIAAASSNTAAICPDCHGHTGIFYCRRCGNQPGHPSWWRHAAEQPEAAEPDEQTKQEQS